MTTKCRIVLIAAQFLFVFILFSSVVAEQTAQESEPSKEATRNYILERINDVNLRNSSMSIRTKSKLIKLNISHVQNASINNCLLTIKETKKENEDVVLDKTMTVPIAKLNPSNIKTDSNRLILFTTNDGMDVKLDAKYRKDAKGKWTIDTRAIDAIGIKYSKGQGDKIARAFSHLIKLCGGQEDMF